MFLPVFADNSASKTPEEVIRYTNVYCLRNLHVTKGAEIKGRAFYVSGTDIAGYEQKVSKSCKTKREAEKRMQSLALAHNILEVNGGSGI